MLYFWVSVAYSVVNPVLALLILTRSRRNLLSQFYAFCVTALTALGVFGYFCTRPDPPLPQGVLMAACAFLYSVFPFFFLHFMLIFVRRYEILRSRRTLLAVYFAGLFSYVMVLLGMVPIPFSPETGVSVTGYIYYLTWMSILFSIGVALLYSLVGGFGEHGMKSNLLFLAFVVLMLLLPTPFTLSLFSIMAEDSAVWFFLTSTAALTVLVYIVFRHRITMNTPYQAMKAALAAMNDILFKMNGEFSIELAQGGVVPILGYREAELQGLSLLSFLRNPEPLVRFRTDVLADRFRECAFETEILCKNGTVLPMEFSFTPVFVNEEATGFVGVGRDIAARRHAERVRACLYAIAGASETGPSLSAFLGELPDILRRVLRADTVHVALHDAGTGRISHPCFRDDRGMGPPAPGADSHPIHDVIRNGRPLTLPDGDAPCRTGHASWMAAPLIAGGDVIGALAVGTYSPTTSFGDLQREALLHISAQVAQSLAKKLSDEALRRSEESYRLFFEHDLTADFIATPDGRIRDCNPTFVEIFGFASREEACGSPLDLLYPVPGRRAETFGVLRTRGKLTYHEEVLRRVDGGTLHVVQNLVAVFDPAGVFTHVRGYIFDATERFRLEEQLRQAQKLENLGAMAGGIAHDFNNILTIMSVHLAMLKPEDQRTPHGPTSLDALGKAVRRGAGLVGQLLTFARKTEVQVAPVEVNAAVRELHNMLDATLPKTIDLRLELDPRVGTIQADANQLHQVLLNLCLNARDAMPAGGSLTVSTGIQEGLLLRSRFRDAKSGPYASIRVTDTGTGMDEATRGKIFEPFFTTKEKGKGTGLGLAVVYGVVNAHHGFIDVDSAPGAGSTFTLLFPGEPCAAPPVAESHAQQEEAGHGATLLFVEDEEPVRTTMALVLRQSGFIVHTAGDGREAVEVFAAHAGEIDLVVTDVGLPVRTGWEAYREMLRIRPDIRALFVTGFLSPELRDAMQEQGRPQCLQKPYTPAGLLAAVAARLAEAVPRQKRGPGGQFCPFPGR
jgi:PAS domain S-box-containing protein